MNIVKDIISKLTIFDTGRGRGGGNGNGYGRGRGDNTIDKESIEKYIDLTIESHQMFTEPLLRLSPKEFTQVWSEYSAKSAAVSKLPATEALAKYRSALKGTALSLENKYFMNSLITANTKMISELKIIRKNIDYLIESDGICLRRSRLSNLGLMGILRQCDILARWSCYIWSHVVSVVTEAGTTSPKYRYMFLERHTPMIVTLVSDICENRVPVGYVDEVRKLKKNMADTNLYTSDEQINTALGVSNLAGYSKGFLGSLSILIDMLNIFRWPVEMWDEYLYRKNLENVELKNWMEQHVALLRLQMLNTSKDDPKYYKLQRIIEAYDIKITEYAEKINKYEEES